MIRIAVDAMGGDNAPECTVLGAQMAVKEYKDMYFDQLIAKAREEGVQEEVKEAE